MNLREEIARIVCCLADNPAECAYCKSRRGCPGWPDIAEKVSTILKKVAAAVEKVENTDSPFYLTHNGFEKARQDILKLIRGE